MSMKAPGSSSSSTSFPPPPSSAGGRGRKSGSFVSAPEQTRLDARKNELKRRASAELGADNEDSDEEEEPVEGGTVKVKNHNKSNATSTGRKKIDIEFIPEKAKRTVSFTKRKAGLMKKAFELSTLTGTQCLVLVVSESGLVYTYATDKFKPLVELPSGKRFIQRALNSSHPLYDSLLDDSMGVEYKDDNMVRENMDIDNGITPGTGEFKADNNRDEGVFRSPLEMVANALVDDGSYIGRNGMPSMQSQQQFPPTFSPLDIANLPTNPFPAHNVQHSLGAMDRLGTAQALAVNQGRLFPACEPTPYERAEAEHAIALASYQANQQFLPPLSAAYPTSANAMAKRPSYGAHSFTDTARSRARGFGNASGSGTNSPTWMAEARSVRTNLEEDIPLSTAGPSMVIETRRKGWEALAEASLEEASRIPTISIFVQAYLQHRQSTFNLPPALPTSAGHRTDIMFGEEAILNGFVTICRGLNIVKGDQLTSGIRIMLDQEAIATPLESDSKRNSTRKCLSSLIEFLFLHNSIGLEAREEICNLTLPLDPSAAVLFPSGSHSLMTPSEAGALEDWDFDESRMDVGSDPRSEKAASLFQQWVIESQFMTGGNGTRDNGGVTGWFTVYRTRASYVVLKELTLEGSIITNALLSPFKLRVPKLLAAALKIDDGIRLSIVSVESEGKRFWLPNSFSGFNPATDPAAVESDVDIETYSTELKRLLVASTIATSTSAEKEEIEIQIRLNRSIIDELERARSILEEGEY